MAAHNGIQFYGIENVVIAYELNKVPNWALFCGKQFQFKYDEGTDLEEGSTKLTSILTRLAEVKNSNTYMLCTYEELGDGEKIKNTTPYNGSFNFRLNEEDQYLSSNGNYSKKLDERLTKIEAALITEEEEETKPAGIAGFLGSLLERPEMQSYIFQKVFSLMDKIFPNSPNALPNAAVATMNGINENSPQIEKIQTAITALMQIDEKLGDNLLKVAEMAKSNPNKYFSLISML